MSLDLSTFAINWWTFVADESFVVSKTFSYNSIVSTRSRGYQLYTIIGFNQSLARFLFFLLLLLLFLLLTLKSRHCVIARLSLFVARKGCLLQWFDNRLKMPVQYRILLDFISLQSAMFLANRFACFLDLGIFSYSRTSAMFVSGKVSTDHMTIS